MATCPRCGAENKPTATMCRMCATPLDSPAIGSTSKPSDHSSSKSSSTGSNEILCATCGAVNGATWSFCQQCGSPMNRVAAANPSLSPSSNVAASNPQPSSLPPPAPPTVISTPLVAAPPTVASKPARSESSSPIPQLDFNKVTPNQPSSSGEGVACISCGKANILGSSFCAACGAPLPVEKTLIMKAQPRTNLQARLRLIQETGGEGEIYKLESDEILIGRNSGDIRFPHDGYMSGKHARIVREGDHYVLVDENSRNGTFKKIDGQVKLKSGDVLLIGKQLFRFEM